LMILLLLSHFQTNSKENTLIINLEEE
jgi:hypothetical protein